MAEIPRGFNAYDRNYADQGYTERVAINPEGLDMDLEGSGFLLSDDQASPVKRVLIGKGQDRGGFQQVPQEIRDEAMKIAEKHMGFKQIKKTNVFEFAIAHKQLLSQGRVPNEVAHYRLTVCTGHTAEGIKVSMPCPAYTGDQDGRRGSGHCRGCGCPEWEIAEMNRDGLMNKLAPGKAWYPMGCPKGRFSAEPGRRSGARD